MLAIGQCVAVPRRFASGEEGTMQKPRIFDRFRRDATVREGARPRAADLKPQLGVPEWRAKAFGQFSDAVELPLLLLSVVMIPVIIIPLADSHLPKGVASTFDALDYFIWAIFALEYAIKFMLAPRRGHYVIHNPLDAIVVAVPMLRPLRIVRSARALRLLRLTRLGAFAGEGTQKTKRSLHVRGVGYVVAVTTFLVIVSSVVVYDLERDVKGASIKTLPDALWWAITTVTTVGYGDKVPTSAGARAIAVVLMLTGIGLIGVITAALATFFVSQSGASRQANAVAAAAENAPADQTQLIEELMARLATIESLLRASHIVPNPATTASVSDST
jgi:voltage-gated potassium channel